MERSTLTSAVVLASTLLLATAAVDTFELTVVHTNDLHVRYLPIHEKSLSECEIEQSDCVAGASRVVALAKHLRNTEKNVLFLNAGDHFQGTIWYTFYKSEIVSKVVALMQHDAMALGNHEFDDGPEELNKFIDLVHGEEKRNLSILCCNIDIDPKSVLHGKVHKSMIKEVEGRQVAIIGFLTPDTVFLSSPGDLVQFRDETESIREEIARIKANNSEVNIFIALGHSGLERELEIAKAIPDLDLVVGGHSHSFMYSRTPLPSSDKPEGEYPEVIDHGSGNKTLYVQAFAFGKYFGKLDLIFNEDGQVIGYGPEVIFVDSTFPKDNQTEELIVEMSGSLNEIYSKVIGQSDVELDGVSCRTGECNLGNMISDALVKALVPSFENYLPVSNSTIAGFCSRLLGTINGGNIRSSISKGNISYRSVVSALPFPNTLYIYTVTGLELWQLFRQSAGQYGRGGFLQVSKGIQAKFEVLGRRQAELIDLRADCGKGLEKVEVNNTYSVVISSFIANGGDNYSIDSSKLKHFNDFDLTEIVTNFVKNSTLITVNKDGRIVVFDEGNSASPFGQSNLTILASVLIALRLIL